MSLEDLVVDMHQKVHDIYQRTSTIEAQVNAMHEGQKEHKEEMTQAKLKIDAIESQVDQVKGVMKFIGFISIATSVLLALLKLSNQL